MAFESNFQPATVVQLVVVVTGSSDVQMCDTTRYWNPRTDDKCSRQKQFAKMLLGFMIGRVCGELFVRLNCWAWHVGEHVSESRGTHVQVQ
jgi:hypothetical protein